MDGTKRGRRNHGDRVNNTGGYKVGQCHTKPYEPAPTYPSVFNRAWESALRAAQDSGIVVTFTDRDAGVIRGSKDGIDATIPMVRLAWRAASRASSIATRHFHGASMGG